MKHMPRAALPVLLLPLASCSAGDAAVTREARAVAAEPTIAIELSPVTTILPATGIAAPYAEVSLGTKLTGTVTEVRVREGDRVGRGEPLLVMDARDLHARQAQVAASIAEAEAMHGEAAAHAKRMRDLYAEQAAPKAQLEAAETALARAEAAFRAARAGAAELDAIADYAIVRAPFDGVVVRRIVDPGAFAAPGTPLLAVQDAARLRITATTSPDAVRGIRRGDVLDATIEGRPARAVVEGIVPAGAGSVYTINAVVDNAAGAYLPGSAATLELPQGTVDVVLVPLAAIIREGDLTGVRVQVDGRGELRWIRLGRTHGDAVEVLAGLRPGDRIVLPANALIRS